jgi:GlpG protein
MHKFGWRSLDEIWDGQYWALVTTTFVHYSLLHVFFNVSAFRVLGEWMERAIGPIRFLIFCLVTAFVSSSFQVAVSSGTVVGISGIVYGIFGFMWLARWRFPEFHRVLDRRTIRMAFGWLLVCYLITFFDVLPIGNTAHTVGLAFGVLVAALFVLPRRRVLVVATLLALIAASVVPLYWSPWSADWLQHQAFAAHRAGRLTEAIDWYTKALELDPDDSWSLHNRGNCYLEIDEPLKALDDFNRAKQVVAGNRKRAASDSTKKDVK